MERDELVAMARKADAAGDADGVRRILAAIDALGAPESASAEAPKPKAGDLIGEAQKGSSFFTDVGKGVGRIVDTVTGGPDPVRPGEVADIAENAIRSGTAPLGGDYIAAAGSAVTGKGFNPQEQRARREELAAANPTTAMASELLGVGGVAKVLAPLGGGVATQGAVTGGVTAANEKGLDPVAIAEGAAGGAIGGKVAEKVIQGVNPLAALGKKLLGSDGKPLKAKELSDEFARLKAASGRNPTMAELAQSINDKNSQNLAKFSEGRGGNTAQTFTDAAKADLVARPDRAAASITNGGDVTGNVATLGARDTAFDAVMKNTGNRLGVVRPDEAAKLLDPDVLRSLDRAAKQKLMDAVQNNKPAFLSVRDMDTVRRSLGKAVSAAQADGANYAPLVVGRDLARDIAGRMSPEYKAGLNAYEASSARAGAAATGEKIAAASPGDFAAIAAKLDANEGRGLASGARKELTEAAGASDSAAIRTAKAVQQPGMLSKMETVFGKPEAKRIAEVGELETAGADAFKTITKGGVADSVTAEEGAKIGEAFVKAGVRANKGFGAIDIAKAVAKPLKALGMGRGVGEKLAQIYTEPGGAQKVIDYLTAAKVKPEAIKKVSAIFGAVAAPAAADAVGIR